MLDLKTVQALPTATMIAGARLEAVPGPSVSNVTDIPRTCGLLTARELEITEEYSASRLVRAIAEGRVTSEEATLAYLKRAGIAQQLINCCTEFLTEEALTRARELDEHLARTGRPVGPLHGLPISVKEHLNLKGKPCNAGYVGWINRVPDVDNVTLKCLKDAGAVIFCRTTQPQTIMHLECSNNISGVTVNAYNRSLTSGGSSGGEGALLGIKGSPLGVGTDIGGSIRVPAANNGVYGLRPTTCRISPLYSHGNQKGRQSILGVLGPLGQSVEDLALFMKTVIDQKPWFLDPSLTPLPWTPVTVDLAQLRIAVMWTDGVVSPQPPMARALREMVALLKRAGAQIEEWSPLDPDSTWPLTSRLYYLNGAEEEREIMHAAHDEMRPLTKFIINQPGIKRHSIAEARQLILQREEYRTRTCAKWNETVDSNGKTIDVILCPAHVGPAPKLNESVYWNYASLWNLLDYPAAVFPVTSVRDDDAYPRDFVPANEHDRFQYQTYDYKDAPVNLQVVARRYEDEKVLAVVEAMSKLLD